MNKAELEKEISEANTAYAAGIPFMTDEEYDILWQQLHIIDPTNDLLYHTAQQRTNLTGKTWHKYPIFGTNKAFNMQDLRPYLTRFGSHELLIEPKYDGCAAVITKIKSGWLITLEGDGKCGSDITHLLPYIQCPFKLRHFQAVEILLPFSDWNPDYGKNPRNVVAGWLSRIHDAPDAKMTAVPHNFGPLQVSYTYNGDLENFNELLLKLYAEWSKIYPLDGLMIKVADEKARLIAGNNGQTNHWSIAWKPPIQIKKSPVVKIENNVSRLGRIIPTVVYAPIDLCGTINTRVTGNNMQWLEEKQIQIGSILSIGKAGEIIPKIVNVENSKPYKKENVIPNICPICNSELIREGVHLVCKADKCIAKLIVSIAYFYSWKGIKIDGIGEATIEKLLQNPNCYKVLSERPWALLDSYTYRIMAEMKTILGTTIFHNIYQQIRQANKTKNMAHFISGLGLPGVAYKTSLRLCQYLKTGILNIPVSDRAKDSFCKAVLIFNDAKKEMQKFYFTNLPSPAKAIYCITGTLTQSREAMIESLSLIGYEFSAGVTRETNYLIVGENPGNTKIAKATRYNIPKITEEQFIKLLHKE